MNLVFHLIIFVFNILVRVLETARNTGNFAVDASEIALENMKSESSSSEDGENEFEGDVRRKRMKPNAF